MIKWKRLLPILFLAGSISYCVIDSGIIKKHKSLMFPGDYYSMENDVSIYDLKSQIYKKEKKSVFIVKDYHKPGVAKTLDKIVELIHDYKIDLVSCEGLEGNITKDILNNIAEDTLYIEKLKEIAKEPEAYVAPSTKVVAAKSEIYLLRNSNRPFLGESPARLFAPELYGKIPLFGFEDMDLYQKILDTYICSDMQHLRKGIELEVEGVSVGVPKSIMKNSTYLLDKIDQLIFQIGQDNNLLNLSEKEFKRTEISTRSKIAVDNTLEFMEENRYNSVILVIGRTHLPSVKFRLEQSGYNPGGYIEFNPVISGTY